MDTQTYKQAVTDMYTAMQEVFVANEKLQRLTQIVWDWDKQAPLPASPPSEPEDDAVTEPYSCGCASDVWRPCVHECSICLKALTLKDGEGTCFQCEKDLVDIPKQFPADTADAKMNSVYGEGAFHALIARMRADGCRGSATDTEDAKEVRQFLKEAERLDARATELLYNKAKSTFKPWWFTRWSYPLPESSYKPVCGDCEKPKEDDMGHCTLCAKPFTCCYVSKNHKFACFICEEDLRTLSQHYPEDAAEANAVCASAFDALILRTQANDNREAAFDTENQVERAQCLVEAERLDARATDILKNNAPAFKPWWLERWDYWRQPGSTHEVPDWASSPAPAPAPAPSPAPAPAPAPVAAPVAKAKPNYNHANWPSPRPKLFAKACAPDRAFKKHQDALEFLAEKAGITVNDLLKMDPDTYIQKHMWNRAPQFWKGSAWRVYY